MVAGFNFLVCLTLATAVLSSPQGAREKFKENFLANSPCGENVKPVSCKCESGEEFNIGEGKPACKPKAWESCTCPSGETVEVDMEEAFKAFKQEMRKELILEKSPCGAGVEPSECACENGETFVPDFMPGQKPCEGSKFSSCTCPNGETFDKDKIKEVIKALRADRSHARGASSAAVPVLMEKHLTKTRSKRLSKLL